MLTRTTVIRLAVLTALVALAGDAVSAHGVSGKDAVFLQGLDGWGTARRCCWAYSAACVRIRF